MLSTVLCHIKFTNEILADATLTLRVKDYKLAHSEPMKIENTVGEQRVRHQCDSRPNNDKPNEYINHVEHYRSVLFSDINNFVRTIQYIHFRINGNITPLYYYDDHHRDEKRFGNRSFIVVASHVLISRYLAGKIEIIAPH